MNYLMVGNDSYLLNQQLKKIERQLYPSDSYETIILDSRVESYSLDDLIMQLTTIPFLYPNKIIIAYYPTFLANNKKDEKEKEKEKKKLEDYFNHVSYDTSLIFVCDKIDRRGQLFNLLKQKCQVIDIAPLDDAGKQQFVNGYLKTTSIRLTNQDYQYLLARLDNDATNIISQLDKLALYPGRINQSVIDQIITKPLETSSFALSNAISKKDIDSALHIYHDLLLQGNTEVALIALLASNFRTYYQVSVLDERGLSEYDIANELKMNRFRLKYIYPVIANMNSKQCLQILNLLATLDQDVKNGLVDANLGFEIMLLKLKQNWSIQ